MGWRLWMRRWIFWPPSCNGPLIVLVRRRLFGCKSWSSLCGTSLRFNTPLNEAHRLITKGDSDSESDSFICCCPRVGNFSTDVSKFHHFPPPPPLLLLAFDVSVALNSNRDDWFSSRLRFSLNRIDGRLLGHNFDGRAIGVSCQLNVNKNRNRCC